MRFDKVTIMIIVLENCVSFNDFSFPACATFQDSENQTNHSRLARVKQ